MSATERPIIVVGAGLSGLSLAACLSHLEIPFVLFEASPRHAAVQGYGITLRPWSYMELLETLSSNHNKSQAGSTTLDFCRTVAVDADVGGVGGIEAGLLDAHTGQVVVPSEAMAAGDDGLCRANRGKIREWLIRRIENDCNEGRVFWGMKVIAVNKSKKGDQLVEVVTDRGDLVSGSLVVAADGIKSTLRNLVAPAVQPRNIGARVYNWQHTVSTTRFSNSLASAFGDSNVVMGVGDNVILGRTINNRTQGEVCLSWTLSKPVDQDDEGAQHPALILDPALLHRLIQEELKRLHPLVPPFDDLIERTLDSSDKLYHWRVRSLRFPRKVLLRTLEESKIIFIGDAAHAMSIFAGEGGNHALRDASQLARLLRGSAAINIAKIGEAFYDQAFDRWQKGVDDSEARFFGLHKPLEQWREVAKMQANQQGNHTRA